MFGVDEHERQQRRNKNEIERQSHTHAVMPRHHNKQRSRQKLNRRITDRNVFLALSALRAESDVAKNRNVVVKRDHRAARRAARVGKNDRLIVRNAMNDDVEEAADDCAENSGKNVTDDRGN